MSSEPRPHVLVLGASSGYGAASALAFARAGYDVIGVHLDRRGGLDRVARLRAALEAAGATVRLFNRNAADDGRRAEILDELADLPAGSVRVLLHSLAFGTLGPLVPGPGERGLSRRQIEMTLDVMAHSLVYWARDLVERGLMGEGGRIFGLSSLGSHQAWASYGAVAAAKAALEAYIRQLALELAPRGITANAIMAGVCDTPALARIPNAEEIVAKALGKNPHDRLTRPEDVAACLVELARPGTYWMTGNVIRVDGGEDACA